jgi:hypothetical protein
VYGDLVIRKDTLRKDNIPFIHFYGTIGVEYMHEVLTETVGQYTGLKDIKLLKIYEGDIVKFADWKPKVVEYGTCGFIGFGLKDTQKFLMEYDSYVMEVIGNIHENPELLKGVE